MVTVLVVYELGGIEVVNVTSVEQVSTRVKVVTEWEHVFSVQGTVTVLLV